MLAKQTNVFSSSGSRAIHKIMQIQAKSFCDSDCGMVVGARRADLSSSETADLLEFFAHSSHLSLHSDMVWKTKTSSEQKSVGENAS